MKVSKIKLYFLAFMIFLNILSISFFSSKYFLSLTDEASQHLLGGLPR